MKKLLILATVLLTGGFALPAAAQSHRVAYTPSLQIFISGYSHGVPIYSKRIRSGHSYRTVRLTSYERKKYLERQRYLKAQRYHKSHLLKNSYKRSHSSRSYSRNSRR